MQFGIGSRNCVGMSLAIKELNIVLSNLVLNYKFKFPDYLKNKNINIKFGLARVIDPEMPLIVEHRVKSVQCGDNTSSIQSPLVTTMTK